VVLNWEEGTKGEVEIDLRPSVDSTSTTRDQPKLEATAPNLNLLQATSTTAIDFHNNHGPDAR
jgi:hypothetical protein